MIAAIGAAGWAVYRLERIAFLLTLAMFFAYVIGAELGGIAGLFIAVPLVAVATVIARHAFEWRVPPAVAP